MSTGTVISPVVSATSAAKIAAPPPVKTSSVVMPPVCAALTSVDQTAVPGVVG